MYERQERLHRGSRRVDKHRRFTQEAAVHVHVKTTSQHWLFHTNHDLCYNTNQVVVLPKPNQPLHNVNHAATFLHTWHQAEKKRTYDGSEKSRCNVSVVCWNIKYHLFIVVTWLIIIIMIMIISTIQTYFQNPSHCRANHRRVSIPDMFLCSDWTKLRSNYKTKQCWSYFIWINIMLLLYCFCLKRFRNTF